MGQYTEGSIQIVLTSEEVAEKVADQIKNLDDYIKSKLNEYFTTNVMSVDTFSECVDITLSSGRYPNLVWQLDQVFEMCKELFGGEMLRFEADYTVPETYIVYEKEGLS